MFPGLHAAIMKNHLGPIRVVEGENLRLSECIGGAEACRMAWIPLDLDRPAHVAFHQDTCRATARR